MKDYFFITSSCFFDFIFTITIAIISTRKVRSIAIKAGRSDSYVISMNYARNYILVFIFCYSVGIANRVINAINPSISIFWLNICHGAIFPLQGLLNGIVFGYNNFRTIHRALIKKINEYRNSLPLDLNMNDYTLLQDNETSNSNSRDEIRRDISNVNGINSK